ncbi:hypothetical protein DSO57_1021735 [Entomophthora muscae]|uniref:Uncharacterized protein n=1 Tax=Entomophthora muscae TaxID=34485 RepID=A0ACC2RI63_9FUNG|nr:hypothetical protein DSO57_1021735 [Entomophthora muscae]
MDEITSQLKNQLSGSGLNPGPTDLKPIHPFDPANSPPLTEAHTQDHKNSIASLTSNSRTYAEDSTALIGLLANLLEEITDVNSAVQPGLGNGTEEIQLLFLGGNQQTAPSPGVIPLSENPQMCPFTFSARAQGLLTLNY